MKKIYLSIVLLASLVLGACSSNDNDDSKNAAYSEEKVSEAPEWQIDWSNSQDCPDWSEPDGTLYENWTILMVQIEETLQPFVSENDMMAIFVNGELRGLANPATIMDGELTGTATFLMKAYGNETSKETVHASLQYYSQKLNMSISIWIQYCSKNKLFLPSPSKAKAPGLSEVRGSQRVIQFAAAGTMLSQKLRCTACVPGDRTTSPGRVRAWRSPSCRG